MPAASATLLHTATDAITVGSESVRVVSVVAQHPNGRTEGARIAFRTGGVVGMGVVGLGLLGAATVVLLYRADAPAVVQVSVGSAANNVLRLAIAVAAAGVAFGAVIYSRLRAARVDREGRLENEAHLA